MQSPEQVSLHVLLVASAANALAAGFLWLHENQLFNGVRIPVPRRSNL
jgi:hypothetical protein